MQTDAINLFNCLYQNVPDEGNINFRFKDKNELVTEEFLAINCESEEITNLLEKHQNDNCWYGVNLRNGAKGTKETISHIVAAHLDHDNITLEVQKKLSEFLKPTITVQSSYPNHRQLLWVFKEPYERDQIQKTENINQRLIGYFGGDPGTHDASRVLRIPGTINYKYPDHPECKIIELNPDCQYSLDDFDILPEADIPPEGDESTDKIYLDRLGKIMQCSFLQHCDTDRKTLSEQEWYKMVCILAHQTGGAKLIHSLSRGYPKYSQQETDKKIVHAINDGGPAKCIKIKSLYDCGRDCGITSPVMLAFNRNSQDQEPEDHPSDIQDKEQGKEETQKTNADKVETIDVALSDEEKSELLFKDFSDTENARRFLKFNKGIFLWIEDLQRWWYFNPDRPGWDDGEMAVRYYMKRTANLVNTLILSAAFTDDKQRLDKLKQCIAWKDSNGIENSIRMLRDENYVKSTKFDTNPFLFLCRSGVINLQTLTLDNLKPSDYLYKISPVKFDPSAECPQWLQFLKDTFLNDEGLIHFLHKWCGYTMTGDTGEEKFLILEGPGANGKSTLLETMAGVLGQYAVPVPFATFKEAQWDQGGNAHQADIVNLIGARFVRSIEIKERAKLNIERIKSLTGNDEISGRPPHARDYIRFYPVCKLWLAVNHLPKIYDTTHSCWRRILRIPFSYKVPEDKIIKNYSKKLLREEAPGILNWMLEGCQLWQKEGLNPIPSKVQNATNEYQNDSSPVRKFVLERCKTGKSENEVIDTFYLAFTAWWKEEKGDSTPISKIRVGKELRQMDIQGFDTGKIENKKCYIGLRLKTSEELSKEQEGKNE